MQPAKFTPAPKTQIVPAPAVLLTVTDRAAQELKAAMASEAERYEGLRLGLEAGGCNGYQYALAFATGAEPTDIVTESNGVKVFVNSEDANVLRGATVDFVESPMGAGFHIKNPNAKSSCSCGNSFEA